MTEGQWLSCDEPRRMLGFLRTRGKGSDRKARLLMCALARSFWGDLGDERSQLAVEDAEAFADGVGSFEAMTHAAGLAIQAHLEFRESFLAARRAAGGKYRKHVKEAAARADASAIAVWAAASWPFGFWDSVTTYCGDPLDFYDDTAVMDALLRRHGVLFAEVFGNPFSPATLDPAWLAPGEGAVPTLAHALYQTGRFEEAPVLADALEDAGCADADLLYHLRSAGPHVRGCWAIDLLLGRT